MIHAVGDSHAVATFAGIAEVTSYHIGPVTMWRLGSPDDVLLPAVVAQLGLGPHDMLIACCGEIDVRCHVGPQAAHQRREPGDVIVDIAECYLNRVCALDAGEAAVGVLAVVPPVPAERAINAAFPVAGSLADRVVWTDRLNLELRAGCDERGLLFVDINTPYRDAAGALRTELSDGCVHIRDTTLVRNALTDMLIELEATR